ncbi:phage tail tip protein J-related protein, partial [Escherichia coli]|uniref:phage tail tip protein J-related protein n=1 Tax=Escherichia coli TaxID=562 RepID=UPI004043DCE3
PPPPPAPPGGGRPARQAGAWWARCDRGDRRSGGVRSTDPGDPSGIRLTPGHFARPATPHLAVYDPTVQCEFWFSEKRITDIRQVETTARYLGTALYWIAA